MERSSSGPVLAGRVLSLDSEVINREMLAAVTKALSSDTRVAILRLLGERTCSVLEIADALDLPQSTATLHINILESAGLIKTDLQPAKRGCAWNRSTHQITMEVSDLEAGVYSFWAVIDSQNDIVESSETDNVGNGLITIMPTGTNNIFASVVFR